MLVSDQLEIGVPQKHFLIVDDEPSICEMMAGALEDAGYTVDVATAATEATNLLHKRRYEVAVIDWQLPDGDGVTIANLAAQLGSHAFVMSGLLAQLSSSAIDLRQTLMKPVGPSVLLAAARAFISEDVATKQSEARNEM